MTTAAKVAQEKAEHPERFCGMRRCLWRVVHRDGRVTPCPKHPMFDAPLTPEGRGER